VNLSDLAACAAKPLAFSLALADAHGCELIGGDTTQGPLNICITVFGEVPLAGQGSQALLRSGARAGDDLYVSGTLGDARLALEVMHDTLSVPQTVFAAARLRLECPTPRVRLGLALRGIASAAIDISNGLLGDLGHILKQSGVGATINTDVALQLMSSLTTLQTEGDAALSPAHALAWVLAGGDDYELLFTAPPALRDAVARAAQGSQTPVTRIGHIEAQRGLRLVNGQGQVLPNSYRSFDHFA
jgi:thiamine-monophosphate kinase